MNKQIRIGHTADVHLAYKQYGLAERERDFRDAFRFIVDTAIKLKLDALIIAGDLFEMSRLEGDIVAFATECIYTLKQNGVAVIGIDGNHDQADNKWLHVCGIFDIDSRFVKITNNSTAENYDAKKYFDCTIRGFNFARGTQIRETLIEWASREKADILVLHQGLTEFSPIDKAAEISAAEIASIVAGTGVKYVALGHYHSALQKEVGGIVFRYCGSPEMNDISENLDKTFTILTITKDKKIDISTVDIPARKIKLVNIENLQQLDEFCDSKEELETEPLFIVYYNKNLIDIVKRLEEALDKRDCLYRLVPAELVETVNETKLVRAEAITNLLQLIRTESVKWIGREISEDEYQLIVQYLGSPDNSAVITNGFLKSKGLNLIVKD